MAGYTPCRLGRYAQSVSLPATPTGVPAEPLLSVRDLGIRFGTRVAVGGVSFAIHPGETLGLVGESGSGKSVTSLALLRLLPPAAVITGALQLRGTDLLSLSEREMRAHRGQSVAMVFQEPMTALNPVMAIGRQVGEAVLAHAPHTGRHALRDRVLAALHEVALPEPERRLGDYPHQFSGGQRQRIVIAMALINRPSLLIADEPTTALDVTVQAQILTLLGRLRREHGLAMLFISHDLAVVGQVADRIAVMRAGKILEEAPAHQLLTTPRHPYTRALLAAAPTMQTRRDLPLAVEVGKAGRSKK